MVVAAGVVQERPGASRSDRRLHGRRCRGQGVGLRRQVAGSATAAGRRHPSQANLGLTCRDLVPNRSISNRDAGPDRLTVSDGCASLSLTTLTMQPPARRTSAGLGCRSLQLDLRVGLGLVQDRALGLGRGGSSGLAGTGRLRRLPAPPVVRSGSPPRSPRQDPRGPWDPVGRQQRWRGVGHAASRHAEISRVDIDWVHRHAAPSPARHAGRRATV